MNLVTDIVRTFYSAMAKRDAQGLRIVLSNDFSFQGPMMKLDDPDSFANMMATFPFEATVSGSRFIVDGDTVAHTFLWEMVAPEKAKIPMCEILTVANGKIRRSELYFDTKLFPVA